MMPPAECLHIVEDILAALPQFNNMVGLPFRVVKPTPPARTAITLENLLA
jgi:hypothetical protein